jgi:glucosamine--fructose-6-phosphate aminotransferase (isomerizing)
MLKEINEQPDVIKKTAETYVNKDSKELIKNMPNLDKYKNITIVACGSAMHAGLIGKTLIEEYGNIPVNVEIASEFRYKKLFIDEDTLVIAISQSGETADTLEAVKIAREKGCDTLGIINVPSSSIDRAVEYTLYTKAGPEIAVATTKAYSAQAATLSLLAYKLAQINNNNLDDIKSFLEDLQKLPIEMQKLLDNYDEYKEIAENIYNDNDIFFIGRGIDYALCMEGSLKLKEISYIHSEAYAAGELKHGTISLINDGTPVIGIVTDENIADKTISNIKEVKSRGANVIYLTTDELNKDGDFYDKKIIIPKTNKLLQPLLTIIPLQLISYEVAKLRNCDIDKPKNLAKSVTVE